MKARFATDQADAYGLACHRCGGTIVSLRLDSKTLAQWTHCESCRAEGAVEFRPEAFESSKRSAYGLPAEDEVEQFIASATAVEAFGAVRRMRAF